MEVFSVFATMSLVDMLSNPLERINKKLKGVDGSISGLGKRMGALTMSMMPVVVGAGLLLGPLVWRRLRRLNLRVLWPMLQRL